MKVDEFLGYISKAARRNGIRTPYIVGGVPRDRIMAAKRKINDIDITTGDEGSIRLAKIIGETLPNAIYRAYNDGHASIDFMGIHVDFSSNFVAPGVKEELVKENKDYEDPMKLELFSRDFTMNTLLESLDFSTIYDLTGAAVTDINLKVIRCPVDPNISIGIDARRILRAIKFSVKFGFSIDESLRVAMKRYKDKITELPKKFVQDRIAEIVRIDEDAAIDLLIEYRILPLVDLPKSVYDVLIQKRKLLSAI